MNDNLKRVYKEFRNRKDFLLLSHTVDPETDSVPILKQYADAHGVNDDRWKFVTGEKKSFMKSQEKDIYWMRKKATEEKKISFIHRILLSLIRNIISEVFMMGRIAWK